MPSINTFTQCNLQPQGKYAWGQAPPVQNGSPRGNVTALDYTVSPVQDVVLTRQTWSQHLERHGGRVLAKEK